MKQHITLEQLNELSKKGKEKYYEWSFKLTRKEIESSFSFTIEDLIKNGRIRLMNIGQMIEFLDEEEFHEFVGIEKSHINWTVWMKDNTYQEIKIISKHGKTQKELCDALWKAVKEVLEVK